LRFLIRIVPPNHSENRILDSLRTVSKSVGISVHNPKWTSYGALELDVFAPSGPDFETFVAIVEPLGRVEFVSDLNAALKHLSDEQLFRKARTYFNSERYWECHEILEGAWRLRKGGEKLYVQGIILVCAAFVHHQRGNDVVAHAVIERALKQLDFDSERYHGIDVGLLKSRVQMIASTGGFVNFRI